MAVPLKNRMCYPQIWVKLFATIPINFWALPFTSDTILSRKQVIIYFLFFEGCVETSPVFVTFLSVSCRANLRKISTWHFQEGCSIFRVQNFFVEKIWSHLKSIYLHLQAWTVSYKNSSIIMETIRLVIGKSLIIVKVEKVVWAFLIFFI